MYTAEKILHRLDAADLHGTTLPLALCQDCAAVLRVTGVGMALITDIGHQGLIAATDEVAAVLEELQFSLGEGPCLTSVALGRPVLQPQLRKTGPAQWPGMAPAAVDAGIEAVFAFPLQVEQNYVGVLDLYRDAPGGMSVDEVVQAQSFADAAAHILMRLQRQVLPGGGLHSDLMEPEHDRAEVHQATGIVSVQAGVALDEALLLLKAKAFSESRGIGSLARDVVARKVNFLSDAIADETGRG